MGFNSVYRVLQEVFPEVDSRLLRAVAIEHPKDADAAVEVVLVEVMPYLSKQLATPSSSYKGGSLPNPSKVVVDDDTSAQPNDAVSVDANHLDGLVNGSSVYDANGINHHLCVENGDDESISLEKCGESCKTGPNTSSYVISTASIHEHSACDDQGCENCEGEEITSLRKCQVSSAEVGEYVQTSHSMCLALENRTTGVNGSINGHLHADCEDLNRFTDSIINSDSHGGSHQEKPCIDGFALEINSVVPIPSPVPECSQDATESSLKLVVMPDSLTADIMNPEPSFFYAASEKDISTSGMVDFEDESMTTMDTRSGKICSMDLLEDIIEDARNIKKTLVSAMDSVISLIREVELQEEAADQVKEAAARGCLDILAKVDEVKQALQRAKEANNMDAGEVYAEKAILATEVKELQLRLLSLSEERDKSLKIVDEMRQTLELRLTAAEKVRVAKEQEKKEKQASSLEALAFQERIMEEVVQESKILKQEAEENSKLREFLMDRGRVVDMLQGEVSVTCQDVKLLKEKLDRRVPLIKSLSGSQTISILASSSSASKSMTLPELVLPELADSYETINNTSAELADSYEILNGTSANPVDSYETLNKTSAELADSYETLKKTNAKSSIDDHLSSGEEKARDDRKVLVEDGWEFFFNLDFYM